MIQTIKLETETTMATRVDQFSHARPLPAKEQLDGQLESWARTGMPWSREKSVVDFIREHVQSRPAAIALKDGDATMDYETMDRLSNRIANRLLRAGLQPEGIVALPLNRSLAYVVAALGVLKAGGSYLPIDLDTPDQLLRWQLEDSGTKFVFTHPGEVSRFSGWSGQVFPLSDGMETLAEESEEPMTVPSLPNRRAYVVYTSGSTGKPKGVEIEHHSLTNLICFYHQWLGLTAADRGALIANVAFDASVADLWPVLCAGGAVHIAPSALLTDLDGLIRWLADEEISGGVIPTGLMELMLTRPWPAQMALRYLGTGGDTLHVRPPPGLPFTLINQYGPTENTVDSMWAVIEPHGNSRPTIGRPIGNVTAYVLNEHGQLAQSGEEGELFLGGEQVARGYLNRPELTSERFLPDPFSSKPAARMYRTGDWVRLLADGEMDFLGRRDLQVQIRGRRVELGEIEQQLHSHPAVLQACCKPLMDDHSVSGIIAHVATNGSRLQLADQLRAHLATRVPAHMIPASFVFYESLPVTSRGKVDRAALRAEATRLSAFEASLPEGSEERAIAQLWFQLLPSAGEADVNATFESLGGDSLHAIKLLIGVEKITGRRIPHSTFLLEPTLPGLFRAAKAQQPSQNECVIVLRAGGSKAPIFCLYGVQGDIAHYAELAKVLDEDRPVYGIRSPGLEDFSKLPQTMEEAGAHALKLITEIQPDRAPILIGYSWGASLAFEVARQWMETHDSQPFVGMVGADGPRRPTSTGYRIWHFFRWLPSWVLEKARDGTQRRFSQMCRRFLLFFVNDPVAKPSVIPDEDWASSDIARHFLGMADHYFPNVRRPLMVHLFRETLSQGRIATHPLESSCTNQLPDCGWGYWAKQKVRLFWLHTDHQAILRQPMVGKLAESLRALINRCYSSIMVSWFGLLEQEICIL